VITGAASGIGRGLAKYYSQLEIKIAFADVKEKALAAAESSLQSGGAETIAVFTDVSKIEDVKALAKKND
jgi:NAD(P)-dependent dehydrogenase (short-subunit alcohol dehydrogenase family)